MYSVFNLSTLLTLGRYEAGYVPLLLAKASELKDLICPRVVLYLWILTLILRFV